MGQVPLLVLCSRVVCQIKRHVTQISQTGFLNLLEEGGEVMANKGFLIQGLKEVNAALVIPPFLEKSKVCNVSGGKQFTASAVFNTQEIARLRINLNFWIINSK